jgi:hypothetical protein
LVWCGRQLPRFSFNSAPVYSGSIDLLTQKGKKAE